MPRKKLFALYSIKQEQPARTQRDGLETIRALVAEALWSLPAEEREVIEGRFLEGKKRTLKQLGTQLGCSHETIRQINKRALERLRHVLPADQFQENKD